MEGENSNRLSFRKLACLHFRATKSQFVRNPTYDLLSSLRGSSSMLKGNPDDRGSLLVFQEEFL